MQLAGFWQGMLSMTARWSTDVRLISDLPADCSNWLCHVMLTCDPFHTRQHATGPGCCDSVHIKGHMYRRKGPDLWDATFSWRVNGAAETMSTFDFQFTDCTQKPPPSKTPSGNNHEGNSNLAVRALSAPTSKRREGESARGKRGKRLESEGSENKRETEVSRNNISDQNKP